MNEQLPLDVDVMAWHTRLGINFVRRPGIDGYTCACHRGTVWRYCFQLLDVHDVPTRVVEEMYRREENRPRPAPPRKERPLARVV